MQGADGFIGMTRIFPAPFQECHALVAQGIEHRFPKPVVAGSNPAGGTHKSLFCKDLFFAANRPSHLRIGFSQEFTRTPLYPAVRLRFASSAVSEFAKSQFWASIAALSRS